MLEYLIMIGLSIVYGYNNAVHIKLLRIVFYISHISPCRLALVSCKLVILNQWARGF